MAAGVASAATVIGGGLATLWGYNRGNYGMDNKLHYSRFVSVNNQAISAQNQYRADIADLTGLTCVRMVQYIDNACIGFHIMTALYCPGRLGLHESPPPSWLTSLYMLNMGATYVWLVIAFWLGLQATIRADVGQTHMLTRYVRLPVPCSATLDRARKIYQSYEELPIREVLRVPFLRTNKGGPKNAGSDDAMKDEETMRRARTGNDLPGWHARERFIDHGNVSVETMLDQKQRSGQSRPDEDPNLPEHFKVFAEIQNEWWPYDAYCRCAMLFAHLHLLHAWSYFQLGHHFCQVRAVFAAALPTICIFVLQNIYLSLDIVGKKGTFPFEKIGPFGPLFAYIAMGFEYQKFYTKGGLVISAIMVFCAFGCQIIYTYALWFQSQPEESAQQRKATYTPAKWRLPRAWAHALWLVAPPLRQDPDVTDLPGELRDEYNKAKQGFVSGSGNVLEMHGGTDKEKKKGEVHQAFASPHNVPSQAWTIVQWTLFGTIFFWIWCTFGYCADLLQQGTDTPSLVSAPGLPNNARDPRYRPAKPGFAHAQEVGTGVHAMKAAGEHRLLLEDDAELGASSPFDMRLELAEKLRSLLPEMRELVDASKAEESSQAIMDKAVADALAEWPKRPPTLSGRVAVQWPALFEPRLLACGPGGAAGIAAFSPNGRGTLVTAPPAHGGRRMTAEPGSFVLVGAASSGPLRAASWDGEGLLLATGNGIILNCPGAGPEAGRWACHPLAGKLPIGLGKESPVIAVARTAGGLRAAVAFPGEDTVTLFSRPAQAEAPWLPAGEVHFGTEAVALSLSGDTLHLLSAGGAVEQVQLSEGVSQSVVGLAWGGEWRSVCSPFDGAVARLGLAAEGPTLLVSES